MARRRRTKRRPKAKRGPTHNDYNRANAASRGKEKMLDEGKEPELRYYIKEILDSLEIIDENQRPFIQTILAKGFRNNLQEARLFVKEKYDEEMIPLESAKKIDGILKKYSKWR